MTQPLRFSSAASLVVLGSMIAGCAAPQARTASATHFGGKANVDMAYATRALAALNSNNVPVAIDLAERAVAKTPNDAGFRALLGNAYFAGGRFLSAEQAYRDALSLYSDQPQVVLKLALVEIAQGKHDQAISVLNERRDLLDASDYGLAIALAGRPAEAVKLLDAAARQKDADATVRQNLALAHALAGDWNEARIVASQDVPANQLDARMNQWMQLAAPKKASDQVASLVGVKPAVADPGQPVQLALNKADAALAVASATAPTQKAPAPVAKAVVAAQVAPAPSAPVVTPAIAPVPTPAPVIVASVPPAPPPARATLAALASSVATEAKSVLTALMPHNEPVARPAKPRVLAAAAKHPAFRNGKSPIVVQLGAYQSADRVMAAWNGDARKFGALKAYLPMSARFASAKGTFYRLSVHGFGNVAEAKALCTSVRSHGGSCFVRNVAGDAPVQFASR